MESFNGKPERMLLTARQVAELLAISERSVWTLTHSGSLPAIRIGRSVRYPVDALRAWLDGRRQPPAQAPPDGQADLGGRPDGG
jgi:excisionase family DNA binding protein